MGVLFMVALLLPSLSGCLGEDLLLTEDRSEFEATLREDDGVLRVLTYDIASLSGRSFRTSPTKRALRLNSFVPTTLETSWNRCCCTEVRLDVACQLDGSYLPSRQPVPIHLHGVDLTGLDGAVLEEGASLTDHGVPFDHGYICLNVDGVVETATSLWNLTEDEWTGKVAIPSRWFSPGRAFFLATLQGLRRMVVVGSDAPQRAHHHHRMVEAYEIHYGGGWRLEEATSAMPRLFVSCTTTAWRPTATTARNPPPSRSRARSTNRYGAVLAVRNHGCRPSLRTWSAPKPTLRCRTRT